VKSKRKVSATCAYGHPMDAVLKSGRRYCSQCNRNRVKAWAKKNPKK
jgi:hypothetical protein